jgi:hypothetical protein
VRVVLNGPSGSFHVNVEREQLYGEHTKKPYPLITYSNRFYEYAGAQDGAHFYRERT